MEDVSAPPGAAANEHDALVDGEVYDPLTDDAMLQEAAARVGRGRGSNGPRELFWGTLAPLSLLGALAVAALVLFAATAFFGDASEYGLPYAGIAALGAIFVYLPLNYYLVRSRLERPIQRLEYELKGQLPWQPEGDVLLGSVRRAIEQVRSAAYSAREELEEESGRLEETYARLQELQQADRFADEVASALGGPQKMDELAGSIGDLVHRVWPADELMLMRVEDQEVQILYRESRGRPVGEEEASDAGGYRRNALPQPVKEALRRGFYVETGLPFSQDPMFPEARSFVAMSLEHRGGASGILLAVSSELTPPPAEPLRRARPLFGLAYSRSMYLHEMEEAALRDALTGVYTHNHFLSLVRHEVARSNRYSRPATCIMLDIDVLRRVNDNYGPGRGDGVITEVAGLIQNIVRSTDTVARTTGGTFAILLPETKTESALVVAERIRQSVEEHPFIIQRGQLERMTVTVGLAGHPPHGVTALSLVDAARRALREGKRAGRNRVIVASPPPERTQEGAPVPV